MTAPDTRINELHTLIEEENTIMAAARARRARYEAELTALEHATTTPDANAKTTDIVHHILHTRTLNNRQIREHLANNYGRHIPSNSLSSTLGHLIKSGRVIKIDNSTYTAT